MRVRFAARHSAVRLLLFLAGLWALQASCKPEQNPISKAGGIDAASDTVFGNYVRSLQFVSDPEAGDHRPLLVGSYPDSARFGPLATIAPERHAYKGSVSDLKTGRIIARIVDEGAEPYPKLGLLPHTTTYWWVQYDAAAPTDTIRTRSVFVTLDTNSHIVGRRNGKLEIHDTHISFRVDQALARFVWVDKDDDAWGSCAGVCCRKKT
jgi:hypothetical protein